MSQDALVAVRAIHFASTAIIAGAIVFLLLIALPAFRAAGTRTEDVKEIIARIRGIIYGGLAVALASGVAWFVLQAASMSGSPVGQAIGDQATWIAMTQTTFGIVSETRLILMVFLAAILWLPLSAPGTKAGAAALALLSLGALAWTGHAAATKGATGYVHITADVLHLLAAGTWLGSLIPLALLLAAARRRQDQTWAQTARIGTLRFSTLGMVSVGTLVVSGAINTWLLAGTIPALIGTAYGRLLLAKIILFAIMLAVAATNRLRLTPRLANGPGSVPAPDALRQLTRNAWIEVFLGLMIFAIVGLLGTLVPGLHNQPDWPFPFRFRGEFAGDPPWTPDMLASLGAIMLGLALILGGLIWREGRWPLLIAGTLTATFSVPALDDLLFEAYPTTFHASPTGYSTASIARGSQLFADNCSACHGITAAGDGPAAASATVKPPNLTSEHIRAHTEGDLFWWITHGIGDAMPAFKDALDDNARWNLIDFIHANADAAGLIAADGTPTDSGFSTPAFSAQCRGEETVSINELQGRVVNIVDARALAAGEVKSIIERNRAAAVTTVVVTEDTATAAADDICIADDESLAEVLALYRRPGAEDKSGIALLIDPAGLLRAAWTTGQRSDLSDAAAFKKIVETIRQRPATPIGNPAHIHR